MKESILINWKKAKLSILVLYVFVIVFSLYLNIQTYDLSNFPAVFVIFTIICSHLYLQIKKAEKENLQISHLDPADRKSEFNKMLTGGATKMTIICLAAVISGILTLLVTYAI